VNLLTLTSLVQLLFYIENMIYPLYKTIYLNEEINCTEPSLSASIPWTDDQKDDEKHRNFFFNFDSFFGIFPPFSPAAGRRQAGFEP
jgi:hypothetical protein